MNAKETLDLISKQWCTTEDLMKLANVSRPTVMKYKKEIAERLIKQEYIITKHLIPMKEVVERLNTYSHMYKSKLNDIVGTINQLY